MQTTPIHTVPSAAEAAPTHSGGARGTTVSGHGFDQWLKDLTPQPQTTSQEESSFESSPDIFNGSPSKTEAPEREPRETEREEDLTQDADDILDDSDSLPAKEETSHEERDEERDTYEEERTSLPSSKEDEASAADKPSKPKVSETPEEKNTETVAAPTPETTETSSDTPSGEPETLEELDPATQKEVDQTVQTLMEMLLPFLEGKITPETLQSDVQLQKTLEDLAKNPEFQKITDLLQSLKDTLFSKLDPQSAQSAWQDTLKNLFQQPQMQALFGSLTPKVETANLPGSLIQDQPEDTAKLLANTESKTLPQKAQQKVQQWLDTLFSKLTPGKESALPAALTPEKTLQEILPTAKPLIFEPAKVTENLQPAANSANSQTGNENPRDPNAETGKDLPPSLLKKTLETVESDSAFKTETSSDLTLVKTTPIASAQTAPLAATVKDAVAPMETTGAIKADPALPTALNGLDKNALETKSSQALPGNERLASYLTKAFAAETQIVDRIVSQATLRISQGAHEIHFDLLPPDLGRIKITLHEVGGLLTGKILVDNPVIKEIVESNLKELKNSLSEVTRLDKLEVEVREQSSGERNFFRESNKTGDKNAERQNLYQSYLDNEDGTEGEIGNEMPLPEGVRKTPGAWSVDLIG